MNKERRIPLTSDQKEYVNRIIQDRELNIESPEHVGNNYASAPYQVLFKDSANTMGLDYTSMDLFKNKDGFFNSLGLSAGDTVWINEKSLKNSDPLFLTYIMLHELNHSKHNDFAASIPFLGIGQNLSKNYHSLIKSNKDLSKYHEYQAEIAALANLGSAAKIRRLAHLNEKEDMPGTEVNDNGYLTKQGILKFAQIAEEQEKRRGKNKLQEAMEGAGWHFHGSDSVLEKLSLEDLQKERKDFTDYYNNLKEANARYQTGVTLSPDDTNNHKMDMLLANYRMFQFDHALLLHNNDGLNNEQINHEKKRLDASFHQYDDFLKEQARDNALKYTKILGSEKREKLLYPLEADRSIAREKLFENLVKHSSHEKAKKIINNNWVNNEIEKASLDRNYKESAWLKKIHSDYHAQSNKP